MKRLTILVALAALLYGGYWFAGRSAAAAGIGTGIAWLDENGWEVAFDARRTRGFPSRFDTTFDAPRVISPAGLGLSGDWAQILALAWAPTRVIAALPADLVLHLPGGDTAPLRAEGLRASAALAPALSLPLRSVTVESGPLTLGPPAGPIHADRLLLAFRGTPEDAASYDAFGEITALSLPPGLTPPEGLPAAIARASVDLSLVFDRPLDRGLLSDGLPEPRSLVLRRATLVWGEATLAASGELVFEGGLPEGRIDLTLSGLPAFLDLAAALGLVPEGIAAQAALLVGGNGAEVSLPLDFAAGQMRLGPLPLGPAPRF